MSRLLFTFIGILFVQVVFAQECGTPAGAMLVRLQANKNPTWFVPRDAVKYVPITFHLVADSDSNGRVLEENVFLQLHSLNNQFKDQDFIFYIDRLTYTINSTAVYETPSANAAIVQMRLRFDNNSMNVFITNSAEHGSEGPGVTLAYYDPQEDWIVIRKNQVNSGTRTLAHEIGHFFSLDHPFLGWECKPYTDEDYGNPVSANFTLPCDGGGGSALIELQDGSNCNFAGDYICDTPPDYNIGALHQPNNCNPNTTIKDKNGDVITPITNNFMTYYSNCASWIFTPTQKNIMSNDFYSLQRNYIRTGNVPETDSVEAPVSYIFPIGGVTTPGYINVLLDWQDTPGANMYMVMIDRFSGFTFNPQKYFVDESELTIPELSPNLTYFWKVWPYNESRTGAGYSQTQNFKTGIGTGINEISEINDYMLSPNPVDGSHQAWLTLNSVESFESTLTISDASGRSFTKTKITIPSGTSQHVLETQQLPTGIYFIMLHAKSGVLVEKLMLLD